MKRLLLVAASIGLILAGMVTFPLPIPTGLLLMGAGLMILVSASPTARRTLKGLRRAYPRLDRGIRRLMARAPSFISGPLRHTNPD